ncbi:hypothetical protein [Hamadaea tsunoensis]|uniref:hypothetical protein n=1 Tax=Hamadaea tsunoensis TaxID=53368 RepID=UPI0003FF11E2|nr:hypothetical protein [Hamadaea tsunoensis]
MTRDEIRDLLRAARARDNRKITDDLITAWQQDLDDLPYALAEAALRWHYQHSHEWLMAAHIRANAAHLQRERLRAQYRRRQAEAAQADRANRDTRPLRDRSADIQALVHEMAARLTTPASLAITAAWRARRITAGPSRPAPPPPAPPPADLSDTDRAAREAEAIRALHKAGRPCGSPNCARPECVDA